MRSIFFGFLALVFCTGAAWAKEPPWKPSPYQGWMKKGDSLARRKLWIQAEDAYVKALALQPNDPAALLEEGWVVFQQGQLDRALEINQRVLQHAKLSPQKAAAWYNMGRIQEQQHNKDEAIQNYRNSIKNWESGDARLHLSNLDPTYAATNKLQAKWLEGPHKTEDELCDGMHLWLRHEHQFKEKPEDVIPCDFEETTPRGQGIDKLPYLFLFHTKIRIGEYGFDDSQLLAVRTPSGWYFTELSAESPETNSSRYFKERFVLAVTNAVAKQVPGQKQPLLFVSYQTTSTGEPGPYGEFEPWQKIERFLLLCSVTNAGKPSCLEPISVFVQSDKKVLVNVKATFQPNGHLLITGKTADSLHSTRKLMGEHVVDFSKESLDAAESEKVRKRVEEDMGKRKEQQKEIP